MKKLESFFGNVFYKQINFDNKEIIFVNRFEIE